MTIWARFQRTTLLYVHTFKIYSWIGRSLIEGVYIGMQLCKKLKRFHKKENYFSLLFVKSCLTCVANYGNQSN